MRRGPAATCLLVALLGCATVPHSAQPRGVELQAAGDCGAGAQ